MERDEQRRNISPGFHPTIQRVDDQNHRRDCVTQMGMLRNHPDMLTEALRDMGVTENGEGMPEEE